MTRSLATTSQSAPALPGRRSYGDILSTFERLKATRETSAVEQ